MEIIKAEDVEKGKTNVRKVRETKTPVMPPKIAEALNKESNLINPTVAKPTQINPNKPSGELDKIDYSVIYESLCGAQISEVPVKLRYKPIDGFHVAKLNELTLDTIDEGLNDVLDNLCYESKYEGFTHWKMTVDEKIRAFLNLRLNSSGPIIEHLIGICEECGSEQAFIKIEITKFDENELKKEYKEPFPLKAKVGDKTVRFEGRLLRSGDIYRARQIYNKDKGFISSAFPEAKSKDVTIITQILEYANSITSKEGSPITFEEAVVLCKDNIDIMNAITSFNDYFYYGMVLKTTEECTNDECPTVTKDEETGKFKRRGCLFRFPIQPSLFYITYTESENVKQYFDLRDDGEPATEVATQTGN
jgi:hypothetical protein